MTSPASDTACAPSREAFETHLGAEYLATDADIEFSIDDEVYVEPDVQRAWGIWQQFPAVTVLTSDQKTAIYNALYGHESKHSKR